MADIPGGRREHHVLVVEDNVNDATLIRRAIDASAVPVEVTVVADGEEALECLLPSRDGELPAYTPDVILLDLKLPRLDGIDVLRRLKRDDKTRGIPVVMLTSSREERDMRTCYELGVNSYLVKPVEFSKLVTALGAAMTYWLEFNCHP